MTDNATMRIEELKLETGSYQDAIFLFMEQNMIFDVEDVLEIIDKILYNKIAQELINNNNFGSDSPYKKQNKMTDF